MILDARDLPDGEHLAADLCIIGAGAAGITIARELAESEVSVLVLESGGLDYDERTQALYQGENVGLPYDDLDVPRLRYFGGTTNHWAGWCRPLDPIDFAPRPGFREVGWPFGRAEIDPFYRRAQPVCQLGPFAYDDVAAWARGAHWPLPPFEGGALRSALFQVSPPTRFGEVYGPELKRAGNVTVQLNANVVQIRTDEAGGTVMELACRVLDGPAFTVAARHVVLATGGLENARILLLSDQTAPTGLGNGRDQVGRYFMDHVWFETLAYVAFSGAGADLPGHFGGAVHQGVPSFLALAPTPKGIDGGGAFRFVLRPNYVSRRGTDSLKAVAGAFKRLAWPDDFAGHIANIIDDADVVAGAIYKNLFGGSRNPFAEAAPGAGPVPGAYLDLNLEQQPNPDSRVGLARRTDALGQRRIQLDWRLTDRDRRTFGRAVQVLARELGRTGLGRVKADFDPAGDDWPMAFTGSRHHMGTTRMHTEPGQGVVDADCRVHGISNLFIAGSSIFPTSGFANPTLTIVALSLRLADHLKRLFA